MFCHHSYGEQSEVHSYVLLEQYKAYDRHFTISVRKAVSRLKCRDLFRNM